MAAIILFDGVCNLCNGAVNFIIDRDPKAIFKFAALQSEQGQQLLRQAQLPANTLNSVILVQEGQVYTRSAAALRIASQLSGGWKLMSIFRIIPTPLRDWVYDYIAKHRYSWFGHTEACRMPTAELKSRFLSV
jgi:predicted DCC family thiol-disulfide oxidoreductase YuxK